VSKEFRVHLLAIGRVRVRYEKVEKDMGPKVFLPKILNFQDIVYGNENETINGCFF
jgi:hypothetical protein